MTERKPLPRTIRGGRPVFFEDPAVDKVLAMLLNLASEVWAQRERLAAVESLARARGMLQRGEVDAYRFAEDESRQLDALRREFIDGLFRVLQLEVRQRGGSIEPETPSAGAKALRGARTAAAPGKTAAGKARAKAPAKARARRTAGPKSGRRAVPRSRR